MAVDNDLNPVLGIDLGTTFSAIACWDGRGPQAYRIFRPDGETLQSVVHYNPGTDEFLVGKLAYKRGLTSPENMALGVKRLMDDASQQIEIGGRKFSPIELSAKILEYIYKDVAGRYPPGRFKSRGTIVTVPYYFKVHQCNHTREAAKIADINCVGILQEPIAASLSYAWQLVQANPDRDYSENVLIFDLGGGTFDLTLFRLQQTTKQLVFEVLATGGDDRLGGMDFDQKLTQLLLDKEKLTLEGLSRKDELKARQRLLEEAIEAKHTLSATTSTFVGIQDIIPGKNIDIDVTRAEFEALIQPYVDKIESIIENLWNTGNFKPSDVDRVILVGGSSKIPRMKQLLNDMIGADKVYANTNPALCVAEGAAMYAAYLDDREVFGREIEIRTRTCHDLGVEIANGKFHPLIRANHKTPCEKRQIFTTESDNVTSFDINVYQGADRLVKNNSLVGTVSISELPQRPKGELDIVVAFKVNEEQMLSVTVEVEGRRKGDGFKFT